MIKQLPKTALGVLVCLAAGLVAPRAHAVGDISGIWMADRRTSQTLPEDPKFTPAGRAAQDNIASYDNPMARCIVHMPRAMIAWTASAMEIIQSEQRVWVLFESYHQVRRIFLDGRPPVPGEGRLWLGHSVGHWEGDTLVVETINMHGDIPYHWEGLLLSEAAQLEERFTRVDQETLEVLITVTDPVNYEEPWQTRNIWRLDPDAHFFEFECDQVPE